MVEPVTDFGEPCAPNLSYKEWPAETISLPVKTAYFYKFYAVLFAVILNFLLSL